MDRRLPIFWGGEKSTAPARGPRLWERRAEIGVTFLAEAWLVVWTFAVERAVVASWAVAEGGLVQE
jgi:hypothetical protein